MAQIDNIKKGDELMLFVEEQALAFATSHVLTITGNTVEIGSKDSGLWGGSIVGSFTWEITSENLYTADNYDDLFAKMIGREPIDVIFGAASNYAEDGLKDLGGSAEAWEVPTAGYTGKAYITSLVANANHGENATYSITLTGASALTSLA